MLRFPNFTTPFEIHTNASDFVIGWVFMQNGHSIAFESKKLYVKDLKIYKNKGLKV